MALLSQGLFSGLGSAVGDIFGGAASLSTAKGYKSAAEAYTAGAGLYREQGGIYGKMGELSARSGQIDAAGSRLKEVQAEREIYQTIGGQKADVAAAGLDTTGSALDVLRSSVSQGHLQMGVLRNQGLLDQQGYKEEALSYAAMTKASEAAAASSEGQAQASLSQASAAKKSGIGGIIKGALTIGSTLLFSDARLKNSITFMDRREDGIGHYLFKYNGGLNVYLGVLAQEVQEVYPEAVITDPITGFMMVDYAAIGDAMYEVGSA